MIIDSPIATLNNSVSTNVLLDGFQLVENKTKTKVKRKLTTPAFKKKRAQHQSNIVAKNVPSLMSSANIVEPFVNKLLHTTDITHQVRNTQHVQDRQVKNGTQQALRNSPVQSVLPISDPQQISITTESTRYAQTRFPFPPFIIRFNVGKVMSSQIKEDTNHWPTTFCNMNYMFPYSPSIPPQLSLIIKNVDLRLDFKEFSKDIKTNYPQVKNVTRLKNKFNNDIKLLKLELSSAAVREELLFKKKDYCRPFHETMYPDQETCKTYGECIDDLKLHICSNVEKCIHCGQNHKSNSLKCQVVKSFRSELTRKLLSSNNYSSASTSNTVNNLSHSSFQYLSSDFPPMSMPQHLPSNLNNTMLNKMDDLLGKITELNNHFANLELKYSKFEQFMIEKNTIDSSVKQNLNLLSQHSTDLKKELVHHNLLIERHENLLVKLITPMLEDLFELISSQNQDKKGNVLDADLKVKLERYLIQMKKAKEVETGEFDNSFHQKIFQRYRFLHQKGENRNGGVLILIKETFSISRVPCSIPNICVVDIKGEDNFRIIGVYAPDSKSWSWDDLSAFVSTDMLLHWVDDQSLAHAVPNSPTSLRSNRVIDYAFIKGLNLDIQVYNGNTTSDHLPVLSVISLNSSQHKLEKNIHWNVFSFWYRSKRFFKPSSSSLHALIDTSGKIVKECDRMCNLAADYYEIFFKASTIIRPHPYTDSPPTDFDNINDSIPEVTLDELLITIISKKKKKSLDAHGLSNHVFNFIDLNYWSLLLNLYNHSFQKSILPTGWKDTRMILLAKKDSICSPSLTRPISLLDSFQKIGEKLFLTRFRDLLARRGLLPDSQSGFREHFRLQTRLLLFLEDIYSLMSNSAPICTVFVDFRAAFDQLWFLGCIGKLRNLGIPPSYLNWIQAWLVNRRCYIEFNGCSSDATGGPQGSVLTTTSFITYNCDMNSSLSCCIPHFFADDLAGILAGQLGIKYSSQCLDLEKRIETFLDCLEYYSCLTDQPINLNRTETMFSARAIGLPNFDIHFSHGTKESINLISEYKYLGYIIVTDSIHHDSIKSACTH
ncbi:unnamed protein product [Rotaria magnacalcarata]|uniref:Reverse transcriptase domain-containing protein n=2 Tax=Rotaria magnacalcarata TaxID=392030 RepID=A0A815YML8_9BILA|nr:unnamed protein product [Rotaria magnacalcarata]